MQRMARPYMNELSLQSNATVMMGMHDRLNMVCLEVIRSARERFPVRTDAG
jgi:DNA-binding IclR family transcriptional regulator